MKKNKIIILIAIIVFVLVSSFSISKNNTHKMTNAENNHGMDIDKLVIARIDTGKSFVMKRFRARARGRGTRINKPFSHVRIVVTEVEE